MDTNNQQLKLSQFDSLKTIITLDRPILNLLEKGRKKYFMYLTGVRESDSENYLLFKVKSETYLQFLLSEISLFQLIEQHDEIFLFEKKSNGRTINHGIKKAEDLDSAHLPATNSCLNDFPRSYIRWELFGYKFVKDFTHEEYDAMDPILDEAFGALSHTYELRRITHLPEEETPIDRTIRSIAHPDPLAVRERATKLYQEQLNWLKDKYSPSSYDDYDPSKGVGYNVYLLMVGAYSGEYLVVESSMEAYKESIQEQRKEEENIFERMGVKYPAKYKTSI